MKIVYISNSTIPSRAANSIHVMKVCQAFSDLGHEITLFASDKKNDYEINFFLVKAINLKISLVVEG